MPQPAVDRVRQILLRPVELVQMMGGGSATTKPNCNLEVDCAFPGSYCWPSGPVASNSWPFSLTTLMRSAAFVPALEGATVIVTMVPAFSSLVERCLVQPLNISW